MQGLDKHQEVYLLAEVLEMVSVRKYLWWETGLITGFCILVKSLVLLKLKC